jgi:undecaprenyl pyrophosphate synthase
MDIFDSDLSKKLREVDLVIHTAGNKDSELFSISILKLYVLNACTLNLMQQ